MGIHFKKSTIVSLKKSIQGSSIEPFEVVNICFFAFLLIKYNPFISLFNVLLLLVEGNFSGEMAYSLANLILGLF